MEPLHALIDRRMTETSGFEPPRCSDSDFLRRVWLDLAGLPPTADEARAFFADGSGDKRQRLIDKLLNSSHFARHLATTLDLMLMERRGNTHVSADDWRAWLVKSVRENKPWNVMAREILQADGADPAQRPAARFVLDRASEPNLLTRDAGRIFFGRDMQCAQCHDHPIIEDYLQSDYHGLLAFMAACYPVVANQNGAQVTLQAERAGTDLAFESVFVKVPRRTGARVPDEVVLDEPFHLPGEEYQVPPADGVKSVPKFSRRAKLAVSATSGANQSFNRNIVNRLWAHMFGRGLVHPPDLHHSKNPPADPELLQLLADRFVAMNFNMRAFLREIALSGTYQRSFDLPPDLQNLADSAAKAIAKLQAAHAELEKAAQASNDAYIAAADAWQAAEADMLPVAGELDAARNQYAEAKKKLDEAAKAAADVSAQLQAKRTVAATVERAKISAEQAAKALPQEKPLAETTQKLSTRLEQFSAEITALSKAAEEKTAAVKPMSDALAGAKPTVEATLVKSTPLTTKLKQTEHIMLAARRKAAADAEALAAIDRRIETAEHVAATSKLSQALALAKQGLSSRESELTTATKQLEQLSALVAQQEANAKSATESQAAAASALEAARAEHTKHAEAAKAVAAALTTADAARQKMPDDANLSAVVAKLTNESNAAQAKAATLQQQLVACTSAHAAADVAFVTAQESLAAALAQRAQHEQAIEKLRAALATAQAEVAAGQSELDTAVSDLTDRWSRDFTVASLKPLTPEQLCWTVFRVTGVYDRYWQAEVAELDKSKPLTEEQKKDPAQSVAREVEIEQRTFDKLKGNLDTFVAYYGAAAGQPQGDFFSTADQALFAANGGSINSWVTPASDNVTERIVKESDARKAAEELYLAMLTRMPTDEEAAEVGAYLNQRGAERGAAAQELVWGLLNSAEFRFNH
jgi:hypothetical protein